MARALMPGQEEEEKKEDRIYERRNKRMLIDRTSKKTNSKAPAGLTDPGADNNMSDDELHRKTIKFPVNHPRSSSTSSSAFHKESPNKLLKLALWQSFYSRIKDPGPSAGIRIDTGHVESAGSAAGIQSETGYVESGSGTGIRREIGHVESGSGTGTRRETTHVESGSATGIQRKIGHVKSGSTAGIRIGFGHVEYVSAADSGSIDGNALRDLRRILGYGHLLCADGDLEPLFGAERAPKEVSRLPEEVGTSLEKSAEKQQTELDTGKKDNCSKTRKWNSRWLSIEDMLLSLTDSPQMQTEAVCALYRQERKTHEQTSSRIFSDLQYAKLKRIVEFLTAGNVHRLCRKTSEELEDFYRGGVSYCSWLVSTYSSELYSIYRGGFDVNFG